MFIPGISMTAGKKQREDVTTLALWNNKNPKPIRLKNRTDDHGRKTKIHLLGRSRN